MASILIIDDDAQFRAMLRQMLSRAGYEVLEASNGKEGMRIYRDKPADLVITDLIMPEKEGIETISDLRREFPDVKIVAISGGGKMGPDDYLHGAKLIGAERIFTKPLEREEILEAVKKLIDS